MFFRKKIFKSPEQKEAEALPRTKKVQYVAEEIKEKNPDVLREIENLFSNCDIETEFVSHSQLKEKTKDCKAVIRTGETTPYANNILQSGCIFS